MIKKLEKIYDEQGDIDFDVILTEGEEVTLGFLNKGDKDGSKTTRKTNT